MLLAKWVPTVWVRLCCVMIVKPVVGQAVLCNECKAVAGQAVLCNECKAIAGQAVLCKAVAGQAVL